jgi:hypothetical protein
MMAKREDKLVVKPCINVDVVGVYKYKGVGKNEKRHRIGR